MNITIYKGIHKEDSDSYIMLGSKDQRFHDAWGSVVKIPTSAIYSNLKQIVFWCKEELGEECLFEVS